MQNFCFASHYLQRAAAITWPGIFFPLYLSWFSFAGKPDINNLCRTRRVKKGEWTLESFHLVRNRSQIRGGSRCFPSVFYTISYEDTVRRNHNVVVEIKHQQVAEHWREISFSRRNGNCLICCEVKGKIACLICNEKISVPKEHNIRRHYDIHRAQYDLSMGKTSCECRSAHAVRKNYIFTRVHKENESAVEVSHIPSELMARHSKPYTEGEFTTACMTKHPKFWVLKMQGIQGHLIFTKHGVRKDKWDSKRHKWPTESVKFQNFLQSTGIGGVTQLAGSIRACDESLKVVELVRLVRVHETATGEGVSVWKNFRASINSLYQNWCV